MSNYKELSRRIWGDAERGTLEQLTFGAVQRIADAAELMAENHAELVRQRDYYEREYNKRGDRLRMQARQIAAQKGLVTRLKRRLAGPA